MKPEETDNQLEGGPACPVPTAPSTERVTLAHGEGGRLSARLIQERVLAPLERAGVARSTGGDSAPLPSMAKPAVVTTDSFVVSPLFFPGGDIGTLSVFGTVNDLAVSGARPRCLTLALILEEGLPLSTLDRVVASIAAAAQTAGVQIVGGDTKVVTRGAADGMFVNTTGIGELCGSPPPGPNSLRAGDELIVSGDIGRHGIAVLCAREELGLKPPPESDCAAVIEPATVLLTRLGGDLRAMRDPTRGGVAAVLHEWAADANATLSVVESSLPVSAAVRGACELLGLDPLHVANEGALVAAVAAGCGEAAVKLLREAGCRQAAMIGTVGRRRLAPVTVVRALGREQPLDAPLGAPLPRIC